ncbi:hypothetical protein [Govanella unica]|uniref:Uncharacterized protein n=1 Tax=Govanella unica TaxID=2975056 RepID=A0A9X3Z8A3_9PROT|nr:hypothetical protein [Govania unica]MDA5194941.1 hypothetical protein [Govania unica]
MDVAILHDELVSDLGSRGYAAMSDEDVAAALNAREIVTYREVPLVAITREMIMMSDARGRFVWDNVRAAAADSGYVGHDLARRLCFLFEGGLPVNWGGAAAQQLLAQAVAVEFFTAEQADILKDTGKVMISRAEQLGLETVRVGEIMDARREDQDHD